jgi:hypothetical protein
MNVEDRAPFAARADKPVALPRVTEAERATTDLATRHSDIASRTLRYPAGYELGTNRL